jgi:O-acetyl-ADP-ribose deacetylase (regulator of RNase III)
VNDSSNPGDCPYVGLEPFEPAHSDYFFGREFDSKVIADHIISRPTTVLYGASGIGKTSIINVGLPNALNRVNLVQEEAPNEEEDDFFSPANWLVVCLRNWQNPQTLERLFIDAIVEALPDDQRSSFRNAPELRLLPLVTRVIHQTKRPLLIILDQFEEYFLYRDVNTVREFESAIGVIAARRDPQLHLLFTLREDGLHLLDQLRAYIPAILETTIELGRLNDQAVEDAIRGPLLRYNKQYRQSGTPIVLDDRLVSTLIRQLKNTESELVPRSGALPSSGLVELPYLQLALTKLWAKEGGANATTIREAALIELGGVSKIVEDHVNGVMKQLTDRERKLSVWIFDRLVTPIGSKIAYPTAALAAPEVVGPDVSAGEVEALLTKLTPKESRILRPVFTGGLPGFEIFHDVLAPSVLEWKKNYIQSAAYASAPGAGRLAMTTSPVLPFATAAFEVKTRPGLIIGYKTGPIDGIRDVDIWVNSENTDMLMDRFIGRSVSARIRYLGANKDEEGNVIQDTIAEQLRRAVGGRGHVRLGTVLVTRPGSLKTSNNVQRIFHIAVVEATPGTSMRGSQDTLTRSVMSLLDRAEMENKRSTRSILNLCREALTLKSAYYRSILMPLFGAGEGGLSVEDVAERIIPVAIEHFRDVELPTLKEIYFLAFTARHKNACDQVLEKCCDNGTLVRLSTG